MANENSIPFALSGGHLNLGGGSNIFQAQDPRTLGATEYTLVSIVVDESGSVTPFKDLLEKILKAVVMAGYQDPRADHQMVQIITFGGSGVKDVQGFTELSKSPSDFSGTLYPSGGTPLLDATARAVATTAAYAEQLSRQSFSTNAVIFVITDGCENTSRTPMNDLTKVVADLRAMKVKEVDLESIMLMLIGVNMTDPYTAGELDRFKANVGFDTFLKIEDVSAASLGKLAGWISKSISSQSQALGTGGASTVITF